MALSRIRKPFRKSSGISANQRKKNLLYGTDIPLADAISYKIPISQDIMNKNDYTLIMRYDKEEEQILYSPSYADFISRLNEVCTVTSYGDVLCNSIVIYDCCGVPLPGIFNDKKVTLSSNELSYRSIQHLRSSLEHGITILYDKLKSILKVNSKLMMNVHKHKATAISEEFVSKIMEENNVFPGIDS